MEIIPISLLKGEFLNLYLVVNELCVGSLQNETRINYSMARQSLRGWGAFDHVVGSTFFVFYGSIFTHIPMSIF